MVQRSGIDTSSTTPDPGYQWESDKLTEDTTNESQEVSPFPAGDHKAHINRRAQNIANTRQNKNIKDPLTAPERFNNIVDKNMSSS